MRLTLITGCFIAIHTFLFAQTTPPFGLQKFNASIREEITWENGKKIKAQSFPGILNQITLSDKKVTIQMADSILVFAVAEMRRDEYGNFNFKSEKYRIIYFPSKKYIQLLPNGDLYNKEIVFYIDE